MTDKPENPLAFPSGEYDGLEPNKHPLHDGMTLRDYFAAHAYVTLEDAMNSLALDGRKEATHAVLYTRLALMRYAYADAMLKARQA